MQAEIIEKFLASYNVLMKRGHPPKSQQNDFAQRLRAFREVAGLSQREMARRLGISQPAYLMWERHNVALKAEQITQLAENLGVRVEELLKQPKSAQRRGGPEGKGKKLWNAISDLPRSQQAKIFSVLEMIVAQHSNGHKQAA